MQQSTANLTNLMEYQRLLILFADNHISLETSPFGIHNIAKGGLTLGRKPGDWYGPQAISMVLK